MTARTDSELTAKVTDLTARITGLERRADVTDEHLKMHESKYPLVLKVVSIAVSAVATLISVIISLYVFNYVPAEINKDTASIKTDVEVLKTQVAEIKNTNPNKPFDEIKENLKLMDQRNNERMNRIEDSIEKLNDRLNGYVTKKLAGTPQQLKKSYGLALSVRPRKFSESVTVAEDLLVRAKENGITLPRSDTQELARITLPLVNKIDKQEDKDKLWHVLRLLASDNTKVRTGVTGEKFPCKDGQTSLGYGIPVKNVTVANCTVTLGSGLILENVRFINSDFLDVPQGEEGREFFAKLLLSKDLTISMGTPPPGTKPSE